MGWARMALNVVSAEKRPADKAVRQSSMGSSVSKSHNLPFYTLTFHPPFGWEPLMKNLIHAAN